MTGGPVGEPKSVIAVDLRGRGNTRLVERVLAADHDLVLGAHERSLELSDLTIVDPITLHQREMAILHARECAAPVVLPVLLIAEKRDLRNGVVERHLGRTVDDVVRIPTTAAELRTRIDNLLRLRRLSREQYTRHQVTEQALRGTARALRALNAGNELLVRVQQEQELLDAICQIIIDEGNYPLAWVGFGPDTSGHDPGGTLEVRSRAGKVEPEVAGTITLEGPIARALECGQAQTVARLAAEPHAWPFENARPDELASALFLPISPHMGSAGVLAIYSRAPRDFSEAECDLLERLASNVMLGVGTIRADHDRERQRNEIREMAFSDPLTGLSNRTHLVARLDELLHDRVQRPLAILFVDLDHFKLVNDALGHVAGDEVLRQVAYRLANAVREDDLVARQGGDEFIVVMSDEPRSEDSVAYDPDPTPFARRARELASHIARKLREPLIVHGYERRVGVSVGISLYPVHGDHAETLIDKADTAMYGAKTGDDARRIALYEPSMSHERRHRLSLEARLHRAVDEDELELRYQPMVELDSGRIVGAEALLRWPQADGSVVGPGEFIPVAEETGLIGGIGEWVLDAASRQLAEWQRQSVSIPVAVNISPSQLLQIPGDRRRFADLVAAHVDPRWIELEVTENVLMANPESTESILRDFTEQGFRLAVDDFGTGYSSLTRLQHLPIQTLKIDKAFVADLGRTRSGEGIVHTIIELARSLSMRPLAEGIETDAQRSKLLAEGCHCGQGHWFSPPVPAQELARLVRGGSAARQLDHAR